MSETLYRITGLTRTWNTDARKYEPSEKRVTVRRSQKGDLAYYEEYEHAVRGLRGLKGNNSYYSDFRIEAAVPDWSVVS